MRTVLATCLFLATSTCFLPACAEPAGPSAKVLWGEQIEGLVAGIACTTNVYNPHLADTTGGPVVSCYLKNVTNTAIQIRARFGSYKMSLVGQGSTHPFPVALFSHSRLPHNPDGQSIAPGETLLVQRAHLSTFIDPNPKQWSWDWVAHPVGPQSPIHQYNSNLFEKSARFWFAFCFEGDVLRGSRKCTSSQKIEVQIVVREAPKK